MKFLKYFSITKAGIFYWKATVQTSRQAVGVFKYAGRIDSSVCPSHDIDTDKYHVQHGLVTRCVQVFWLWWVFAVELPFESEGYGAGEYVKVVPFSKKQLKCKM